MPRDARVFLDVGLRTVSGLVEIRLVSVDAPSWLHLNAARTPVIAPKPTFEPLD